MSRIVGVEEARELLETWDARVSEPFCRLAHTVVTLTDERDRLRDILDCETGTRAPEGWTFHAPDMSEDGDPRAWWHCGIVTVLSTSIGWERFVGGRRSIHTYALDAISAKEPA